MSPIAFYLDRGLGVPTYLQFVHQVHYALTFGGCLVAALLARNGILVAGRDGRRDAAGRSRPER